MGESYLRIQETHQSSLHFLKCFEILEQKQYKGYIKKDIQTILRKILYLVKQSNQTNRVNHDLSKFFEHYKQIEHKIDQYFCENYLIEKIPFNISNVIMEIKKQAQQTQNTQTITEMSQNSNEEQFQDFLENYDSEIIEDLKKPNLTKQNENHEDASEYIEKVKEIYEKNKDINIFSPFIIYFFLGLNYFFDYDYEKSKVYLEQAVEFLQQDSKIRINKKGLCYVYQAVANVYKELKINDQLKDLKSIFDWQNLVSKDSLDWDEDTCFDKIIKEPISAYLRLYVIDFEQGDYDCCIDYVQKIFQFDQKLQQSIALNFLKGEAYLMDQMYNEAIDSYEIVIEILSSNCGENGEILVGNQDYLGRLFKGIVACCPLVQKNNQNAQILNQQQQKYVQDAKNMQIIQEQGRQNYKIVEKQGQIPLKQQTNQQIRFKENLTNSQFQSPKMNQENQNNLSFVSNVNSIQTVQSNYFGVPLFLSPIKSPNQLRQQSLSVFSPKNMNQNQNKEQKKPYQNQNNSFNQTLTQRESIIENVNQSDIQGYNLNNTYNIDQQKQKLLQRNNSIQYTNRNQQILEQQNQSCILDSDMMQNLPKTYEEYLMQNNIDTKKLNFGASQARQSGRRILSYHEFEVQKQNLEKQKRSIIQQTQELEQQKQREQLINKQSIYSSFYMNQEQNQENIKSGFGSIISSQKKEKNMESQSQQQELNSNQNENQFQQNEFNRESIQQIHDFKKKQQTKLQEKLEQLSLELGQRREQNQKVIYQSQSLKNDLENEEKIQKQQKIIGEQDFLKQLYDQNLDEINQLKIMNNELKKEQFNLSKEIKQLSRMKKNYDFNICQNQDQVSNQTNNQFSIFFNDSMVLSPKNIMQMGQISQKNENPSEQTYCQENKENIPSFSKNYRQRANLLNLNKESDDQDNSFKENTDQEFYLNKQISNKNELSNKQQDQQNDNLYNNTKNYIDNMEEEMEMIIRVQEAEKLKKEIKDKQYQIFQKYLSQNNIDIDQISDKQREQIMKQVYLQSKYDIKNFSNLSDIKEEEENHFLEQSYEASKFIVAAEDNKNSYNYQNDQ
ncbi:hypothetical protein PPERSA_09288 [Pseudocohnilembus persalinus]|uniref:Uncharacterized protein n=1 Tax=Pseudocohnilembus persalinus TaxID=266149 RepID=A0A0V0R546_PSEPJ|nr:hypothetical protein PPERSA_09288 [Pseudocohnilembus persalinus]|eukprot:KRX09618.1 hypothetical protein PPERSA_09288 [Pseudocohnilembus persalinus]